MKNVLESPKDREELLQGVEDIEIKVYPDVLKKLELGQAQYRVLYLIDGIIGDPRDPFWRLRRVSLGLVAIALEVSRQRVNAIVTELWKKGLIKRSVMVGLPETWPSEKWYEAIESYREKENGEQK